MLQNAKVLSKDFFRKNNCLTDIANMATVG